MKAACDGYEYREWSHGGLGVPWRVNQVQFDQLRRDGWRIVQIFDTFTLLDRPIGENATMPRMPEPFVRDTENEIFFADFPHALTGMEGMDKYTLRDWLIGHAVSHGWTYTKLDRLSCELVKDDVHVCVTLDLEGLLLVAGQRTQALGTRR